MKKVLSPSRTSFYLVLNLIEMNCRCRQGKAKKWEGGKHRLSGIFCLSMEITGWVTLALGGMGL